MSNVSENPTRHPLFAVLEKRARVVGVGAAYRSLGFYEFETQQAYCPVVGGTVAKLPIGSVVDQASGIKKTLYHSNAHKHTEETQSRLWVDVDSSSKAADIPFASIEWALPFGFIFDNVPDGFQTADGQYSVMRWRQIIKPLQAFSSFYIFCDDTCVDTNNFVATPRFEKQLMNALESMLISPRFQNWLDSEARRENYPKIPFLSLEDEIHYSPYMAWRYLMKFFGLEANEGLQLSVSIFSNFVRLEDMANYENYLPIKLAVEEYTESQEAAAWIETYPDSQRTSTFHFGFCDIGARGGHDDLLDTKYFKRINKLRDPFSRLTTRDHFQSVAKFYFLYTYEAGLFDRDPEFLITGAFKTNVKSACENMVKNAERLQSRLGVARPVRR